ncbi:MAG: pyruvate dehydrogenase E2 component (dihydrolipoamide acetyltransferase) [Halieaceae bacterium]|jgi:pyruvate dehydrogenase E2 component (dihydrolipoamide acetyltransferase)
MSKIKVVVPDIGGADGVEVIELCIAVGDVVEVEQALVVLESDKASMEVPSSHAGTVVEILVKEGDTVAEGSAVVVLESTAVAASSPEPAPEVVVASPVDVESPVVVESPAVDDKPAAPKTASAAPAEEIVTVPDTGGSDDVEVIEIMVAVGDIVSEGDSLIVLESDKASMEVPSSAAGEVLEMLVKEGDQVSNGDPILRLLATGTAEPAPVSAPASAAPAPAPASAVDGSSRSPRIVEMPASPASVAATTDDTIYAGPAVRKTARELGVSLAQVTGSGPRGRILKEDVQGFVKVALAKPAAGATSGAGIPAIPDIDFSQFGDIDVQDRSRLDKLTAANMSRNWLNVPHVTQFDDADITELEELRKQMKTEAERRGVKLTPLPFLLKAAAVSLRNHAMVNASITADGEKIVYKKYINIGMAVATPAGLVVPVIRDVDKKSLWDLAAETAELAGKAKSRKLRPDDMQGGGFTISSLGGIGGTGFTPIVNAPEVAILGVSKLAVKPLWNGSEFLPRKMLPLALSYDHRVINGADGGGFLTEMVANLTDIRRLLF